MRDFGWNIGANVASGALLYILAVGFGLVRSDRRLMLAAMLLLSPYALMLYVYVKPRHDTVARHTVGLIVLGLSVVPLLPGGGAGELPGLALVCIGVSGYLTWFLIYVRRIESPSFMQVWALIWILAWALAAEVLFIRWLTS